MKKTCLLVVLFFFFMTSTNAQKLEEKNNTFSMKTLPKSIYTTPVFSSNLISFSAINNQLGFAAIQFHFFDTRFYHTNYFTLSTTSLTEKSTNFMINDFKSFSDYKFGKEFLQKTDATKWSHAHFVYKE